MKANILRFNFIELKPGHQICFNQLLLTNSKGKFETGKIENSKVKSFDWTFWNKNLFWYASLKKYFIFHQSFLVEFSIEYIVCQLSAFKKSEQDDIV